MKKQFINRNVSPERWEIAQKSEKEYWKEFTKETLLKEEAERHQKKAEILQEEWKKFIKLGRNSKILQIGCGPEDIINYIKTGKKYAIDPLATFYKNKFGLNYNSMTFLEGRAENLPFKDKFFDLVILANVLDHVESPQKALLEIKRVVKNDGLFYFENLFYQKNFMRTAKVYGTLKQSLTGNIFNIHHPFMFLLRDLKKLISEHFSIIHEKVGREIGFYDNIEELKKIKKKDKKMTVRFLSRLGLYGTINYSCLCRNLLNNS